MISKDEYLNGLSMYTDKVNSLLITIAGGGSGDGTTYTDFTGATSIAGGVSGLVPAPAAGDENKFLRGDGTWASISSGGSASPAVSGGNVLSTVPSTVDGGFWLDFFDDKPVLKLHKNNCNFSFATAKVSQLESARNYLSVWLRFNQSATYDECGHNFTAGGSPTISADYAVSGSALQVTNSADYVACTDGISLGGQDFTIDCWFRCTNQGASYTEIFYLSQNESDYSIRLAMALIANNSFATALHTFQQALSGNAWRAAIGSLIADDEDFRNKLFHCALVYRHDERQVYSYLNGRCFQHVSTTMLESARLYPYVKVGGGNSANTQFTGTIDEFRIHNGIALWTENFAPPTASDYI